MTALQHWLASTFAHLMQALAWPMWGFVVGALVLGGIGLIVYCYVKALEASD